MKQNKLPKDWKWVKLKDICEVVTGTTPPKSDMSNYGNEIPFFKPPHLWDGLISETEEMLSQKGATKARIIPPNTVLVTCIGNLGRTGFVRKEAAFNQQINAILENDKIDGKYIFYQAQSPTFRNQLEKLATGTTVSIVNKGNFETINIPLAPLETQQAIVSKIEELFSDLDKGIEDLKTAQQQLKTYRQSVLKWAFEGKLSNAKVKDGVLPKAWETNSINEVGNINPKLPNKENLDRELEVQFLPMKLVEEIANKIHLIEIKKLHEVLKGSYTPFIDGDIIFAKVTPCMENGKIAVVEKLKNGIGFGSSEFHVVRTDKKVSNKFMFYFLVQDRFRNEAANAMTGAVGLRRVPKQFIENYQIPIPPLEEQHRIVQEIESRLSVADKMEESIAQSLQQAEVLRQSILKKAFSGELV